MSRRIGKFILGGQDFKKMLIERDDLPEDITIMKVDYDLNRGVMWLYLHSDEFEDQGDIGELQCTFLSQEF